GGVSKLRELQLRGQPEFSLRTFASTREYLPPRPFQLEPEWVHSFPHLQRRVFFHHPCRHFHRQFECQLQLVPAARNRIRLFGNHKSNRSVGILFRECTLPQP